ncbi:DNA polymerase-4 [Raineyella antarctica]|uniref:DNA polymerase IV n=1 Tax=Raineyella antarctica TaxID=1577474 RepID=A0A1G6GDS0_9ACTN|nr:DNA polymerase IV [Raineyella antarctica]SDB80148.1 DNA polymerase-4 [Raineyella antarctica]
MSGQVIAHLDLDAFYVSVELRRRPELQGRPVYVGGRHRGVVLSASYQARARGIRSAMPSVTARRLCPDAIALAPDMEEYVEASKAVFAILDTVTDVVEGASVDEAYLDLTRTRTRLGRPEDVLADLRARILGEQGLPSSAGLGPNPFVAKMASREAKPDGLLVVPPQMVTDFLWPLPVDRMWGVGEATADTLHRLGLRTIGDLARTLPATLQRAFGPRQGEKLVELANGRDRRRLMARRPEEHERSIGAQETFPVDVYDPVIVHRELLRLAERTSARLRRARLVGRTITLSLRFANFSSLTRSLTLPEPTDLTDEIHRRAVCLYERLGLQRARVRQVGIRVEGLRDASTVSTQADLFTPEHGWREATAAIDRANLRFGPHAVQRASLTQDW